MANDSKTVETRSARLRLAGDTPVVDRPPAHPVCTPLPLLHTVRACDLIARRCRTVTSASQHRPSALQCPRPAPPRSRAKPICTSAITEPESAIQAPSTAFALLPSSKRIMSCRGGPRPGHLSLARVTRFQGANGGFL